MMKSKFILPAVFMACSVSANAQTITVNFAGSVTDLGVLLQGDGVSIGSAVTGSFSYDPLASGSISSFDIAIDSGFSVSMTGTGNMVVQNDQQNGSATNPADGMTVSSSNTTSTSLGGYSNPEIQFGLLRDNLDGQLWDDTLPPDLSDWANITLADINNPDWRWLDFNVPSTPTSSFSDDQIRFDVSAFEVSAVPVPAAAWLFGSGLVGLIGMARRRS